MYFLWSNIRKEKNNGLVWLVYYFNWKELYSCTNNDPEGIIILTYGLTLGYNVLLTRNANSFMKHLGIYKIPASLFKRQYLTVNRKKEIFFKYKTKEPQSYFTGTEFLTTKVNPNYKVQYLYLLGNRNLLDTRNYILTDYFSDKYLETIKNNHLVKIDNNRIYFLYETS